MDTTAVPGQAYAYYVTAVDRLHNESRPMRVITSGQQAVELAVGQTPAGVAPLAAAPAAVVTPARAAAPAAAPGRTPHSSHREPGNRCASYQSKGEGKTQKRGFLERLFGRLITGCHLRTRHLS